MDATAARAFVESNKATATAELFNLLDKAISDRAAKGWNRACVHDIVKDYSAPIITDAYASVRNNGFTVNVMTHTINW